MFENAWVSSCSVAAGGRWGRGTIGEIREVFEESAK